VIAVIKNIKKAKSEESPGICTSLLANSHVDDHNAGINAISIHAQPVANKVIKNARRALRKQNPAATPATKVEGHPIIRSRIIVNVNAIVKPNHVLFRIIISLV